jgi:S-adenosylmethionine-diacylgycerolhomoserine-N-methlytransferase
MAAPTDHGVLMDRVYRHQRHIYDLTRKYYLLGRDPMLAGLKPPPQGHVLEIGCGTGRNIVAAAGRYIDASFYGIDISTAMLDTAAQSVEQAGLRQRVRLAYADASGFDPERSFGRRRFDRIFISYAISMIPAWRPVLVDAMRHLSPEGELHIVDFGDLAGLPDWSRSGLYAWLRLHHVTPRGDLFDFARELGASRQAAVTERRLYRGYAWIAVIRPQGAEPAGEMAAAA